MSHFNVSSVRNISRLTTLIFAVTTLVLIAINITTNFELAHVREEWDIFETIPTAHNTELNELRHALGFGGMIHQFKNLVLRGDPDRVAAVQSSIDEALAVIDRYRAANPGADDLQALDQIEGVVRQYLNATDVVTRLISAGSSSQIIDQQVWIDDTPALEGLATLDRSVAEGLKHGAEHMTSDFDFMLSLNVVASVITVLLMSLMAVMLMLTFRSITKRIGGEPVQIIQLADRIAKGDLEEEQDEFDRSGHKEAGGILGSLLTMRKDLRSRIEAERSMAAGNERLRQALEHASNSVLVADRDNTIVFANKAVLEMFKHAEQEIKKELPNFDANTIVGSNMDIFHKQPQRQRQLIANLKEGHHTVIQLGVLTLAFAINPVRREDGERLGCIVEWFDRTNELKNEAEVQSLVDAAVSGNLRRRITAHGDSQFFNKLCTGMNKLMDVNEQVIGDMQRVLGGLAEGDLTERVEHSYDGAYQRLMQDANATVDQLTSIISNVKQCAKVIADASTQMLATNDSLNATAQSGAQQATSASTTAQRVMGHVSSVSEAVKEMETSVDQIGKNVTEAVDVATSAVELAQSTNTRVRQLTVSSNDIGNVIKFINSIADQTNLLALNATIEAARAGDAGKGFAVVANEVKELAKGTAKATEEIAQKVNTIQSDSDSAAQAIGEISEIIETISNYQNTISCAVRSQGEATQRISVNTYDAARGNEEISRTSEIVMQGTENTLSAVAQVQTSAEELSDMAAELNELVARFRMSAQTGKRSNVEALSGKSLKAA